MHRIWDNNKSRFVSIAILDCAMPPFKRDAEVLAPYVAALQEIPEDELREVIWLGIAQWFEFPSIDEIKRLWREAYVPVDDIWSGK